MSDEWDKIIHNSPMTKQLIASVEDAVNSLVNEMIMEIMRCKSFSLGEAYLICGECIIRGIKPNSKEFYEFIENYDTLWGA